MKVLVTGGVDYMSSHGCELWGLMVEADTH